VQRSEGGAERSLPASFRNLIASFPTQIARLALKVAFGFSVFSIDFVGMREYKGG